MPAFVERDALGKRQDLSDALALADRKKTIMKAMLPKSVAPTNTLTEWPVDNYPAPSIAGSIDEQPVQAFENVNNVAATISGRVMIQQRAIRISRFADKVMDQAGVGKRKAWAKAVAKGLVIVSRDIETRILSDQDSVAGSGTVAPLTRGYGSWSNTSAQSDLPVDSAFRTPTASVTTTTIANFFDETLTGVLKSQYDQTGDAEMDLTLLAGSTLRQKLSRLTAYSKDDSGFTQVRRFNQDAESAKITMKVSVLDTDFGRVVIRPSSFINAAGDPTSAASRRLGYLFPNVDECLRLRFAWETEAEELASDGGGPRCLISAAYVMECGNPLWLARFAPSA
jgi:hypothetical protein